MIWDRPVCVRRWTVSKASLATAVLSITFPIFVLIGRYVDARRHVLQPAPRARPRRLRAGFALPALIVRACRDARPQRSSRAYLAAMAGASLVVAQRFVWRRRGYAEAAAV